MSPIYHSDSVIHIYIFFFCILCLYGLSQDTEYSSLCQTVGPVAYTFTWNNLHLLTPNSSEKVGLKLNIQKTKIMASSSITS